jgi:YD repeat-containing protein
MKLGRLLCVAILVAAGVSVATAVAKADGVDPRVIVNSDGPDPVNYDGQGPLVETFNPDGFSIDFVYTGTSPLTSLHLLLKDVPKGDIFECLSNVWANCTFDTENSVVDTLSFNEDQTSTLNFFYSGAGPCQNDGGVGGECPGSLESGATFGVTLEVGAPEPSTILLLFAGMLPMLLLTRKRWAVHRLSN